MQLMCNTKMQANSVSALVNEKNLLLEGWPFDSTAPRRAGAPLTRSSAALPYTSNKLPVASSLARGQPIRRVGGLSRARSPRARWPPTGLPRRRCVTPTTQLMRSWQFQSPAGDGGGGKCAGWW